MGKGGVELEWTSYSEAMDLSANIVALPTYSLKFQPIFQLFKCEIVERCHAVGVILTYDFRQVFLIHDGLL